MYKMQCKEIEIEGESRTLCGISDESGFFCEFTDDLEEAHRTVELLNKNKIEPCHVYDIIEDLFYSG